MPYMLAPGARLEIGPGGKMYESMGSCCAPCARGGLGAVDKMGNPIATSPLKQRALDTRAYSAASLVASANLPSASASPGFASSSGATYAIAGLGIAAVGAFFFLRSKKRRRR